MRKLKRNFFKGVAYAAEPDLEMSDSMESHMVSRLEVRVGAQMVELRFRMSIAKFFSCHCNYKAGLLGNFSILSFVSRSFFIYDYFFSELLENFLLLYWMFNMYRIICLLWTV